MATILGGGKQVVSWIHEKDLCRIYIEAIENENFRGPINAVAPAPVNNRQLVLSLAKKRNGKFFVPFPVPAFLLKVVVGEVSIEVLKSTTVSDQKLLSLGFQFSYPTLDDALNDFFPDH
jgi:NAD dependent epimerase/dehydratase family enzyme